MAVGAQVQLSTISGNGNVTEGTPASFTLHADPAPSADLSVNIFASDSVSHCLDTPDASDQYRLTVTIPSGATSHDFTIPTVDDDTDERHCSLTANLNPGSYTRGTPSTTSLGVLDNDDPAVSLSAATYAVDIVFDFINPS